MILLIDNYDSFTYNLVQLAGQSAEIKILRNDHPTLMEEAALADGIIISPGPGTPEEAGESVAVIQHFYKEKPILGICLGHQAIGFAFGETIQQAQEIYHGKASIVNQEGGQLFRGLSDSFEVIRYHSLVIKQQMVSEAFEITAYSEEDGEIMGIEHRKYPVFGLQFHPESIGTKEGSLMVQKFIQLCGGNENERII
ncbi:aminodeoxychorismate/anthranilate synthase component II [Enterococcus sp. BWB1-3]|uniref:anthranilate synthase component II n=1 Tax=Enterococcus sp. BWB1-3 TaxID=2787713 RepID=UPI001921F3E5|nr:aminodeoxychorismate/anthranilate synthase component II [Enterococcus sp. BWB1-3]MBL1228315.1 aminodeoxychorismate/anthranilate synthase component II [Enterococcus sp. BWB1-3]